jgi:hypothetical protein
LVNLRPVSVAARTLSGPLRHRELKEQLTAACISGADRNLHALPAISRTPLQLTA